MVALIPFPVAPPLTSSRPLLDVDSLAWLALPLELVELFRLEGLSPGAVNPLDSTLCDCCGG